MTYDNLSLVPFSILFALFGLWVWSVFKTFSIVYIVYMKCKLVDEMLKKGAPSDCVKKIKLAIVTR